MRVFYRTLDDCSEASGAVVVIDVIRAFTTACFAFAAGASEIIIVSEVEQALDLKRRNSGSLLMGEVGGVKVDDFDFGNSPSQFLDFDLSGVRLIQRTSAGTQGVVQVRHASTLLAASFCCAAATVRYLRSVEPETVTFINTGVLPDGKGTEDSACSEYLTELLLEKSPNPERYLEQVRSSMNAQILSAPPFHAALDVELCTKLDRFDFALKVDREDGQLVMRKVFPTG
jgi:2-phosphosulfolactate phosphatase